MRILRYLIVAEIENYPSRKFNIWFDMKDENPDGKYSSLENIKDTFTGVVLKKAEEYFVGRRFYENEVIFNSINLIDTIILK